MAFGPNVVSIPSPIAKLHSLLCSKIQLHAVRVFRVPWSLHERVWNGSIQ
jgi:hypothetical protein